MRSGRLAAWCLIASLDASPGDSCSEGAILKRIATIRIELDRGQERAARAGFQALRKSTERCAPQMKLHTALADLGLLLGRAKEAENLAEKAVRAARSDYGDHSVELAVALETQTQAWAAQGKWARGEPGVREAMRIVDAHGGERSYLKASLLNTLASLHSGLDDAEGARRQLERSREILDALPASPLQAVVMHNLAAISIRLGQKEEARQRVEEAARMSGSLPGPVRDRMERASAAWKLRERDQKARPAGK